MGDLLKFVPYVGLTLRKDHTCRDVFDYPKKWVRKLFHRLIISKKV